MRGFAFHSGSVEGTPDFLAKGIDHLDPLAWRTLCERLYEFRETHRDELVHFNFPLIYFTERELRGRVIGDEELADAYLTHVAAVEEGRRRRPSRSTPARRWTSRRCTSTPTTGRPGAARCRCATCTARTRRRRSPTGTRTPSGGRWCRTRPATRCSEWPTRHISARRCRSPPAGGPRTGWSPRPATSTTPAATSAATRSGPTSGSSGRRPGTRRSRSTGRSRCSGRCRCAPAPRRSSRTWPGCAGSGPACRRCGSERSRCCARRRRSGRSSWTCSTRRWWRRSAGPRRSATVPLGLPVFVLGAPAGEYGRGRRRDAVRKLPVSGEPSAADPAQGSGRPAPAGADPAPGPPRRRASRLGLTGPAR